MSSKRNPEARHDWQTPEDLAELVTGFAKHIGFTGITLDPATTKENPMGAEYIRTPDCDPDGLETNWFNPLNTMARFVYVNPEYVAKWYAKVQLEAERLPDGNHMVALLPAKPGTGYFSELVSVATAVVFIRGRLVFRGATDPAPFESALVYFGNKPLQFMAWFERLGWAVRC